MLGDLDKIIHEMSVTSEYESGWQKLEITVSPSNIITLSWPAWKLKIVSFKAEPSAFMQAASLEQYALNLEALDTLYEINDILEAAYTVSLMYRILPRISIRTFFNAIANSIRFKINEVSIVL